MKERKEIGKSAPERWQGSGHCRVPWPDSHCDSGPETICRRRRLRFQRRTCVLDGHRCRRRCQPDGLTIVVAFSWRRANCVSMANCSFFFCFFFFLFPASQPASQSASQLGNQPVAPPAGFPNHFHFHSDSTPPAPMPPCSPASPAPCSLSNWSLLTLAWLLWLWVWPQRRCDDCSKGVLAMRFIRPELRTGNWDFICLGWPTRGKKGK